MAVYFGVEMVGVGITVTGSAGPAGVEVGLGYSYANLWVNHSGKIAVYSVSGFDPATLGGGAFVTTTPLKVEAGDKAADWEWLQYLRGYYLDLSTSSGILGTTDAKVAMTIYDRTYTSKKRIELEGVMKLTGASLGSVHVFGALEYFENTVRMEDRSVVIPNLKKRMEEFRALCR